MLENIIIDPEVFLKHGEEDPLKLIDGYYCGKRGDFKYPAINGVPNLKMRHDQDAVTSYDDLIPNFELGERDVDSILKINSLSSRNIEGKTVLLAGTGGGGDIIWLRELNPKRLICLDYSSSLHLIKEKFKDKGIEYVVGDICDMPFKSGSFDTIISQGIIQHTRSPEIAFASQIRTLKEGGVLSIGNLYSQNLHNRKIASLRYRLNLHQDPDRDRSLRYIKRSTALYTFLANTGLYKLHRRLRFPLILHYNNIPGKSFDYYYANALDYYMCKYRHLISADEVKFWSERLGVSFEQSPKGYKITK
jgi:ubiquinone/menaquinone biosynthesis C-methylase UbiE